MKKKSSEHITEKRVGQTAVSATQASSMTLYTCILPPPPGWGQMNPWVPVVYRLIDIQSYCPFHARFSFKSHFNSFPIHMCIGDQ